MPSPGDTLCNVDGKPVWCTPEEVAALQVVSKAAALCKSIDNLLEKEPVFASYFRCAMKERDADFDRMIGMVNALANMKVEEK